MTTSRGSANTAAMDAAVVEMVAAGTLHVLSATDLTPWSARTPTPFYVGAVIRHADARPGKA